MVHTSETGAATSEIKFLVDQVLARPIREWARTYFTPDPHGTGPDADEYESCTLYFDTAQLDVLGRRGSYGRAKYRVRRYGEADVIFLERKLRKPGILIKRRIDCSIDALDLLERTDLARGWCGEWFHRRVLMRRLRPVCQISYRRTARNLDSPDGLVRLTLDTELRIAAIDEARFGHASTTAFLESHVILELKYAGRLPAVCRRLVEEFALSPHSASKYRLGMAGLCRASAYEHAPLAARSGVLDA